MAAALAGLCASPIIFPNSVSADVNLSSSYSAFVAVGHNSPLVGQALGFDLAGKNACQGQNECKGQGGCKSGDNGCKGKNSCKGKGGCGSMDE